MFTAFLLESTVMFISAICNIGPFDHKSVTSHTLKIAKACQQRKEFYLLPMKCLPI